MKLRALEFGLYLLGMSGFWVCGYFSGKRAGLREAQRLVHEIIDQVRQEQIINEGHECAPAKGEATL